jgi:DNA-binding protein HU-beta
MEVVKDNISNGENIYLRGFGTFSTKVRAEKAARNISNNTTVVVPEHKIPFFKPSEEFKSLIK